MKEARLRRRLPRRRRAHRQARLIPAGDARKIVDAISVLRSMEGEDKPLLGRRVVVYGGGNTAIDVARTAKRMGAEPIIVYRRTREKMPAHDFEIEEALQEGVMVKWLSTIKQAGDESLTIEKMALDDKGFPQPTGEFETIEADSLVLALGQDVDLGLLDGVPGLKVTTAWSGRRRHDDRPPGHLRRRRHGARPSATSRSPSATARRRRATSTPGCAARPMRRRPSTRSPLREAQHLVLRRRAEDRAPDARHHPPPVTFEEVQGGLDEGNALFEARRCLSPAATASSATTATASAPTTR
jgi:hypothetical protein